MTVLKEKTKTKGTEMTQEVPELPPDAKLMKLADAMADANLLLWRSNGSYDAEARYIKDRDDLREALTQAVADAWRLCELAQLVMDNWPDGDVDGGDLQEAAIRCGLLEPQTRTEPCSEGCNCMDYYASDEWSEGITCYRKTAL